MQTDTPRINVYIMGMQRNCLAASYPKVRLFLNYNDMGGPAKKIILCWICTVLLFLVTTKIAVIDSEYEKISSRIHFVLCRVRVSPVRHRDGYNDKKLLHWLKVLFIWVISLKYN